MCVFVPFCLQNTYSHWWFSYLKPHVYVPVCELCTQILGSYQKWVTCFKYEKPNWNELLFFKVFFKFLHVFNLKNSIYFFKTWTSQPISIMSWDSKSATHFLSYTSNIWLRDFNNNLKIHIWTGLYFSTGLKNKKNVKLF